MKRKDNPVLFTKIVIVMIVVFVAIGTLVFLVLNGTLGDINNTLNGESNSSNNTNNKKFLMSIEDVKSSSGSLIAYGTVEKGRVSVGDEVQVVGFNAKSKKLTVKGIEIVKRSVNYVDAVQSSVGIKFDIQDLDLKKGQVLSAPNSINSYKKFEANVTILDTNKNKKEDVLKNGTKVTFKMWNIEYFGTLSLLDNKQQNTDSNGQDAKISMSLNDDIAVEKGTEFYIVSSGKTIARGTVTKVY